MTAAVRTATAEDIDHIFHLISGYAEEGIILARTREDIRSSLDDFFVAVEGNAIIGVISFHDYGPSLKEIRSLAVKKTGWKSGTGSLLVRTLIQKILSEGNAKIFCLTYSPQFFMSNGFVEVARDTLPEKIWKDCNNCPDKDNCRETALVYSM
jgi:amino-acid N-acetyltransferase